MACRVEVGPLVESGSTLDLLERDAAGQGNWQLFGGRQQAEQAVEQAVDQARTGGLADEIDITQIYVADAVIAYRHGPGRSSETATIETLQILESDEGLELTARTRYGGEQIRIEGELGLVATLLANEPFPIRLSVSAGGAALEVDGELVEPLATRRLELALS